MSQKTTYFTIALLGLLIPASLSFAADEPQPAPLVITLENHVFSPAVLNIPANEKVKVTVKNLNKTAAEFESHDMHREKIIAPGKEVSVYIGPLDPGTYTYFDEFHSQSTGTIVAK